jgi:hypothetical protein
VVVKPILSKEINSRGQVDLMDFQSNSDGNYKFLMVYQDHLTKFCNIRALTSKHASEVAFNLIEVFTLFGAPHILQSDNGSEFTALVISELKLMWPELVIVHGKPRHPQSQGSVERSNGDIHDMLTAWMRDNESKKWSIGIKFVQLQKNSALNKGIGRSPYEALFGKCATVGLTSETKIPKEILATLEKEEDLLKLQNDSIHTQPVAETNSDTIADVQEIVYSSTEPSAEPSTSVTIEMPKVCSY